MLMTKIKVNWNPLSVEINIFCPNVYNIFNNENLEFINEKKYDLL